LYDLVVNPGLWGLSRSNYRSLQTRFERRFSNGMSLLATFTWSRLMDDSSSDWRGFWSLDVPGPDFYNRKAEYSVSAGDIPLRLTIAPIVEVPFGAGKRWLNRGVASHVLGGWRAAAVYTVSSGAPFGIMDNSYGSCNAAHTLSNRPNMIGDPMPPGFNRNVDHWFDTIAFDSSGTCPAPNLPNIGETAWGVSKRPGRIARERRVIEGQAPDLRPILRDEAYKIAAEALRNAFRHSHARHVEVDLRFDDEQFTLRVRDDGRGIDPHVLASEGLEGPCGLRGMPERAALMGAKTDDLERGRRRHRGGTVRSRRRTLRDSAQAAVAVAAAVVHGPRSRTAQYLIVGRLTDVPATGHAVLSPMT
jgi:hypothetical protein